jgi:membrane associated rhomboid family serine protease
MGFGPPITPPIVKQLIVANVAVYLLQHLVRPVDVLGALRPSLFFSGWLWQPFTYMWLHALGNPLHLLFNMFSLWMFGSQVALLWGDRRFLQYYLICGVGAGFVIAMVPYLVGGNPDIPVVGASGAVMGVLLAFSLTWPDRTILLIFPPIPLKAIYLIPFLFFMEFTSGPANVSHAGHLGGVLAGWIYFRRRGEGRVLPTANQLRYRFNRWRMRRRLRALRNEDDAWSEERRSRDDHRTLH